ncbi:molecular chaperone Hsp33 [Prosthecobacter fusiformis]|uniref:Molecular chaperone Hsp33 n=1 Tax=Prosthecobacter fusiformis TaxID=48464 RepID=A0A4R7S3N3_9BACT|nr:Hsp33 family molecular chaperone HslO [Prosthecobacter fusiformis]TDU73000.1 molecular chaperone Hsp33 [Prosthecobacter fusiformis]
MSQMLSPDLSSTEIRCYFVRKRNCLLVRGRFSPIYMDYYLHLMQHGIKHTDRLDGMLKDSLTGIALHLASRPHDEVCAWTINLSDPLLNIFVTGATVPGRVTGRLFTEDVKDTGKSLFIAQTTRGQQQPRQSMIEFQGTDVLSAVEQFYTQSEQRLTRIFRLDDEDFVQISAEPDADEEWLAGLTDADILTLDQAEHLTLLETRTYVFDCGCTADRMFPMLSRLSEEDLDFIFEDGSATITCPRCAAIFHAPKSDFVEWKARQPA